MYTLSMPNSSTTISSKLAYDYYSDTINLIWLWIELEWDKDFSDYIYHKNTTRDLVTAMLNTSYTTERIDHPNGTYSDQIALLYEKIDEKIEIVETYITEFSKRNQLAPWVYSDEISVQITSIEQQKEKILNNMQIFKVRGSTIQTESQRETFLEAYHRMMQKLSDCIQIAEDII